VPSKEALDALAERLATAKRPMLWVGGGARHAGAAIQRLQKLGFGVVTTTQGRGTVPEDDAGSLGATTSTSRSRQFYQTCDAMLVVGSRLRGNETLKYELKLPRPLPHRCRRRRRRPLLRHRPFVCGDSALALEGLADRLEAALPGRPALLVRAARRARPGRARCATASARTPNWCEQLQAAAGRNFNWVRDVTVSNSTWGNRELRMFEPRAGVHATGGGIGQGMPMAIGAAIGAAVTGSGRKTFCLAGDGGFILNLGELATWCRRRPTW
jgi:acetolactate synthase-1/2/3 large subunit